MIMLYLERYPYSYLKEEIKSKLVDFEYADVLCLKGKYWELIKADIEEAANQLSV